MNEITVIIPCYNSENTICASLNSIENQTLKPKNILLVDDGSTDGTVEVVKTWLKTHINFPLTIISTQNYGVAKARNIALSQTQTPFVAFLDSDDIWHKNKLEKQVQIFNTNQDISIVCTGSNLRKSNSYSRILSIQELFRRNMIVTSSVLAKTNILTNYYFNTSLKHSEDYNLWLKIASKSGKIYLLDEPLLYYESQRQGKLSNDIIAFEKDELANFKNLYKENYITLFSFFFCVFLSILKFLRRLIRN